MSLQGTEQSLIRVATHACACEGKHHFWMNITTTPPPSNCQRASPRSESIADLVFGRVMIFVSEHDEAIYSAYRRSRMAPATGEKVEVRPSSNERRRGG